MMDKNRKIILVIFISTIIFMLFLFWAIKTNFSQLNEACKGKGYVYLINEKQCYNEYAKEFYPLIEDSGTFIIEYKVLDGKK